MKTVLTIEDGKDVSGEKKKVLWVTIFTEIEGIGRVDSVAELPPGTPLEKEISDIVTDILALKQLEIKEKNKKLLDNKKKNVKKNLSK